LIRKAVFQQQIINISAGRNILFMSGYTANVIARQGVLDS
jgi:hypothetical protein